MTRSAWRAPRGCCPAITGVGVLDMAGNASFVLAVQAGSLAVAAVLSSLYPVTTVILATVFLRERVTRSHAVGIGLAAVAIACIGAGLRRVDRRRVSGPARSGPGPPPIVTRSTSAGSRRTTICGEALAVE